MCAASSAVATGGAPGSRVTLSATPGAQPARGDSRDVPALISFLGGTMTVGTDSLTLLFYATARQPALEV